MSTSLPQKHTQLCLLGRGSPLKWIQGDTPAVAIATGRTSLHGYVVVGANRGESEEILAQRLNSSGILALALDYLWCQWLFMVVQGYLEVLMGI